MSPAPLRRPTLEPLRAPGERPAWRADIEGLRGVAVLLVVLYHAAIPGFTGGYVGVDVFFALSGYLITGLLAAEVEATGRLDLGRFYARRVRRLLPAVAAVLVAVAAFGFAFYSPREQARIAQTALMTAAYVSNVHFAREATDYLAAEAETDPLLHTWSLAVEEQFYLVWPLLVALGLAGLSAFRPSPPAGRPRGALDARRLAWVVGAVGAASFVGALALMESLRTHWAFFGSPARAWEFAVGGLGALLPRLRWTPRGDRSVGAQVLGWTGLAAVVACGVVYTGRTPFPGWAAVPVVLGTTWALRAGAGQPATALGHVLSWRPLVTLGRLSYSWYLWHWPVLVFADGLYGAGVGKALPLGVRVGLLALSLALAEASYRFVEDPVRHHRALRDHPARGLVLFAALSTFGVVLALGWRTAARVEAAQPRHARFAAAGERAFSSCGDRLRSEAAPVECVLGDTTSATTLVLYGDSHAYQFAAALDQLGREEGWRIQTMVRPGCGAVDATIWNDRLGRDYLECDAWRAAAFDRVDEIAPALTIYSTYAGVYDHVDREAWVPATERVFRRLSRASGAVLHLRDPPAPGFDVPLCLSRHARLWHDPDAACAYSSTDDRLNPDVYDAQRVAAGRVPNVVSADLSESVCSSTTCSPFGPDGEIVWADAHHLTDAFSERYLSENRDVLRGAIRRALTPSVREPRE